MIGNQKPKNSNLRLIGKSILKFYRPISLIFYTIAIMNIIINIAKNTNIEAIILSITGIAVVYFLKGALEESLESGN